MNASDRVLGFVAGFLVGDALGRPFVGLKGGHIQQLAGARIEGWLADPVLQPDRPDRNCVRGLHSCAGQEFLAALAALFVADDAGRAHAAVCAAHLRDLHGAEAGAPSSLRRPGKPLLRALERWGAEFPWDAQDHVARDEASEGIGPCARTIACALADDADDLAFARLTHLKEPPLVAARVLREAASAMVRLDAPKKPNVRVIVEDLKFGARDFEDRLREESEVATLWKDLQFGMPVARTSEALAVLPSLVESGDDALAERTFLAQAREYAPDRAVTHAQHGFAPVLLPWALYRALGPMSTARAVEDAINRGGETAMAAGLVGALCGARHGIESIPEEWLAGCLAWPFAKNLVEARNAAAVEAWLAAEQQWSAREEAFVAPLRKKAEAAGADKPAPKKKPAKPEEQPPSGPTEELPFAPSPHAWLTEKGDELAPWEKQRLKSERGRRRIDWKEDRREKQKDDGRGAD